MTADQERQWAMFTHLAGLGGFLIPLGSIAGPLVLWLLRKDRSEMIDQHGREVLNFQISILIYFTCAVVMAFFVIGFFLLPAVLVLQVVASILGAIRVNDDEEFHYPLTIKFL